MSVFDGLLSAVVDELRDPAVGAVADLIREHQDGPIPQSVATAVNVVLGPSVAMRIITDRIDWYTTIELHCEARKTAMHRSAYHAVAPILVACITRLRAGNTSFMARLAGLGIVAINPEDGHGNIERDVAAAGDQIGAATYLLVIGHATNTDLTPRL